MKNAIYLTTSLKEEEHTFLLNEGYTPCNPSNQNYHQRLINVLSKIFSLTPISFTPYADVLSSFSDPYLISNKKYIDYFLSKKRTYKVSKNLRPAYIFFDGLNLSAFKSALYLAKKGKALPVLILTDNPNNISGVSSFYLSLFQKLLRQYKKFPSPSILLNQGVAEAVNIPSYFALPFIALKKNVLPQKRKKPYLYYSGNLLERFGFPTFLNAFINWKEKGGKDSPLELLYAGHHTLTHTANKDVQFLGELTEEENISFIEGAKCVLNPRPLDSTLDKESIPSKVFEYLMYAKKIASTPHPSLRKFLSKNSYLFYEASEETFYRFLDNYCKNDATFAEIPENNAQKDIEKELGIDAVLPLLKKYFNV